jgi:hypothetical protein
MPNVVTVTIGRGTRRRLPGMAMVPRLGRFETESMATEWLA